MFPFRKMDGATAQLNAQRLLHDDHNCDANAGMKQVEQKIFAVYVVDVALIRVSPPGRPRIYDVEPVAAILEALLAFDNSGLMDNKSVLAPEMGAELVIRNVAAFLRVLSCLLSVFFLFGRLCGFLGSWLGFVSGRFGFILLGRLGFILLARRVGLIARRLSCLGAGFVLRGLDVVLLVLRVYQRGCPEKGNQNEYPDYSGEFHEFVSFTIRIRVALLLRR
jgi:hypothetical protein